MRRILFLTLACICFLIGASQVHALSSYTYKPVVAHGDPHMTLPNVSSINDSGHIVGGANFFGENHAFITDGTITSDYQIGPSLVAKDIDNRSDITSSANDINNSGHVVGSSMVNSNIQAFIYNGTSITELGTPNSSSNFGHAYAINDGGQVVGSYEASPGAMQAYIYDEVNGMAHLETLGGTNSSANDINNGGQVVGSSWIDDGSGDVHAFIYDPLTDVATDIGTLGGSDSYAYGINESGQVVGQAQNEDSALRAFIYDGMDMVGLGTLGGEDSMATAINDLGQVVGYSQIANGDYHPFLWDAVEGMIDLNDLVVVDSNFKPYDLYFTGIAGLDINNVGQIIAYSGFSYSVRLDPITAPVPEPTTMLLFGTGLIGLAGARRKFKK